MLLDSCSHNPVSEGRYSGADSWVFSLGTALSPRDDTDGDTTEDNRTTRVTLAGVRAAHVQDASADHVLSDGGRPRSARISLSTKLPVDGVYGNITKNIRESTPLL